jgi:ABC-type dipeptide/oligopeptide/nickel transport system permease subunit
MTTGGSRSLRASVVLLGLFALVSAFGNPVARSLFGAGSAITLWTAAAGSTFLATAVAAVLTFAVGNIAGAGAALGPSSADALLSRSMEIAGALPSVVAVVVVRALAPQSSLAVLGLVLGVQRGLSSAKVLRARLLQLQNEEFVLSARALGSGGLRLLRKHLYPHAYGLPLASAALSAAAVVGTDAVLSLVGLDGATSSLGSLLADAATRPAPLLAVWPLVGMLALLVPLQIIADAMENRSSVGRSFL